MSATEAQQAISESGCWAVTAEGKACEERCGLPGKLPYCSKHLRVGDEAFVKVLHPDPSIGHILVARVSLPVGYYAVFWGHCVPSRTSTRREKSHDYLMEFDDDRNIDPTAFPGSVLQFAACPGPDELDNLVYGAISSDHSSCTGLSDFVDPPHVGIVMVTRRPVSPGEQLLLAYETNESKTAQWFQQAGLQWRNVGCEKYPALRHVLVSTVTEELFEERRWADYCAKASESDAGPTTS